MAFSTENQPPECFVSGIRIHKLWGYRDLELPFTRGANILIGRNATGKTSVINVLRYLLTLDFASLLDVRFEEATVTLEAFEGGGRHLLTARIQPNLLSFSLDNERIEMQLPGSWGELQASDVETRQIEFHRRRGMASFRNSALKDKLQAMVPSVWLPVNRSIRDDDEFYRPDHERRSPGSVEEKLEILLGQLSRYRLALEAKLSDRYKDFERKVLSLILFNKDYDNWASFQWESVASDEERNQLAKAFREAGLWDRNMQNRISEHFAAQAEAIQRVQSQKDSPPRYTVEDLFIVPLVRRTKQMIGYARTIEAEKKEIFSGLTKYTDIVSSFLLDKKVGVSEKGEIQISFENKAQNLSYRHLSSGEKQILVLLTQALILEGRPVVYVADEPELSLHVTWQEKLLDSLLALNPKMQLVIATHSPDIVGRRPTLDLERYIK